MPYTKVHSYNGSYFIAVEGLSAFDADQMGEDIRRKASIAINATVKKFRTLAARQMNQEINFGMGYLTRKQGAGKPRLSIRFAGPHSLEAAISGRDRPTSLARFVKGVRTKKRGKAGVTLEVSPGNTTTMRRAFLMGLKSGNTGLALRLKPGEKVENKHIMVQAYSTRTQNSRRPSDRNLYLLYGPSVDQVFRSVAEEMAVPAGEFLEKEFIRLVGANF